MKLTNWTNYPVVETNFTEPSFHQNVADAVKSHSKLIARGNGRCYGDASLGNTVISTLSLKNILSFDQETGIIDVQSGILLSDILEFSVPSGWFLPVTPGTKFISVGGAIASNVHGKNHHKEGSFSKHVLSMQLLTGDGDLKEITPDNKEIFDLTCGGMGLTGIVLSAKIQLHKIESSYISTLNIKAKNLQEVFKLFEENKDVTYSVAWIDCYQKGNKLGRSILMLGEHAIENDLNAKQKRNKLSVSEKPKLSIPFNFPSWTLNGFSIRAFNFLYYWKQFKKRATRITHYEGFFYPLDAILSWNKMYGKRGFIQYQFVLPLETSYEGLQVILEKIRKSGFGSFLAVLKLFGEEDNEISFPMEGYTLALDFPIKPGLFEFLESLDEEVMKYGGRLYLSKDARMSSDTFKKTYPNIKSFNSQFSKFDPNHKFASALSERLGLHS